MKNLKLVLTLVCFVTSLTAHADTRAYCGRVNCAAALDGCQVMDNHTNPSVLVADEQGDQYPYVSMDQGDAIWALYAKCACVEGDVQLKKGTDVFTYFQSVTKIYEVDEARCAKEGL